MLWVTYENVITSFAHREVLLMYVWLTIIVNKHVNISLWINVIKIDSILYSVWSYQGLIYSGTTCIETTNVPGQTQANKQVSPLQDWATLPETHNPVKYSQVPFTNIV